MYFSLRLSPLILDNPSWKGGDSGLVGKESAFPGGFHLPGGSMVTRGTPFSEGEE